MITLPEVTRSPSTRLVMKKNKDTLPVDLALRKGLKAFSRHGFHCDVPPEADRDNSKVRMSQIGYCARAQWFKLHHYQEYLGYKEQMSVETLYVPLHLGHVIEAYILHLLDLGGLTVFNTQQELRDFDGQVIGHIDGILEIRSMCHLLEIKGLKHRSIEELVTIGLHRAIPLYHDQMQYYMWCLGLESGYFVALDKDSSQFYIEFVPFQLERAKFLRQKALAIRNLQQVADIPERFVVRECAFCPLKDMCAAFEGETTFIEKYKQYHESL